MSGSPLSANFLVLVPNLTVRDRVSGVLRGDGLGPPGAQNLYAAFDMVPPEYRDEFHSNILARNWQAIPLASRRDDWISEEVAEAGRCGGGVRSKILSISTSIIVIVAPVSWPQSEALLALKPAGICSNPRRVAARPGTVYYLIRHQQTFGGLELKRLILKTLVVIGRQFR